MTIPSNMYAVAEVRIVRGLRMINTFMQALDQGLKVGIAEVYTINYKAGERVTEERVTLAIKSMQDHLDRTSDEHEIVSYEVLNISYKEKDEEV